MAIPETTSKVADYKPYNFVDALSPYGGPD